MTILLALYLGTSLLLIVLALPLIARKIRPNPLYGFRVQKTLENPEIWYAVNRHAGKRLLATGVIFAAAAVTLNFIPGLSVDAYALVCLAVFVVVFAIGIVQSWQYLKTFG